MIACHISNIAAAAATTLLDKGLVITPQPNSLLGQLCMLSEPVTQTSSTPGNMDGFAKAIEDITSDGSTGISMHSSAQDELQKQLRELLSAQIGTTRQEVKPLVVDFAKAYLEAINQNAVKGVFEGLKVEVMTPCDLYFDDSFKSEIKPYAVNNNSKRTDTMALGGRTHEELIALAQPVASGQLESMKVWLGSLSPEFLNDVWCTNFNNASGAGRHYPLLGLAAFDPVTASNAALLVYLFANNMLKQPPEQEGLELTTFQGVLSDIIKVSGFFINSYAIQIAAFKASERIVLQVRKYEKTVYVYGPVYRDWIAAGGVPDMVLGLLLTDENVFSVQNLNDATPRLKTKLETFATMQRMNEEGKLPEALRQRAMLLALQGLNVPTEIEKTYAAENPEYARRAEALMREELSKMSLDQLRDAHMVAMIIIAKCRFFYTPSYEIIKDIYDAGKANPELTADKAALVAAIRLLSKFMVTQMSVQRV